MKLPAPAKYYNAVVRQFNTSLQTFPSSIVASMFKFEKQPMFEISS
jgi:LemA protein